MKDTSGLQAANKRLATITALQSTLLPWYDAHARVLPWRALPGCAPNPYHVWLSEIMLQQTTVATVKDYFLRFVARWPQIHDLAQASLDEVFHAWQGLGYYSRARSLHRCAQMVVQDFAGRLPTKEQVLLTLPGIGPYTAAAISAIAYDQPTIPVDGNVVRVFSRVFVLKTPLPAVKNDVSVLAKTMLPTYRSGDFAQSLMDLGATICRPKNPNCIVCPLQSLCAGHHQNNARELPYPALKKPKIRRYGIAFWVEDEDRKILLEKRPDQGLLAGLIGLPTTSWRETPWDLDSLEALNEAPFGIKKWEPLPTPVRHTFTHFHLELKVAKGQNHLSSKGLWSSLEGLSSHALPTLMKKVVREVMRFQSNSARYFSTKEQS